MTSWHGELSLHISLPSCEVWGLSAIWFHPTTTRSTARVLSDGRISLRDVMITRGQEEESRFKVSQSPSQSQYVVGPIFVLDNFPGLLGYPSGYTLSFIYLFISDAIDDGSRVGDDDHFPLGARLS